MNRCAASSGPRCTTRRSWVVPSARSAAPAEYKALGYRVVISGISLELTADQENKMSKEQRLQELLLKKSWTDSDVDEVAAMKTLRHLALPPDLLLPSRGLQKLAGIRSLQSLTMPHSRMNEEDMAAIAGMPALWRLDLEGTPMDGAMLEALTAAPRLKDLWLKNTGIDDALMEIIARIPALEWLIITDNPVTDAGLRALCRATRLRTLWLGGTGVTDAGVVTLAPLQSLTALNITGSAVTEQGKSALFTAQQARRKSSRKGDTFVGDETDVANAKRALIEFIEAIEAWNVETTKQARRDSENSFTRDRAAAKVAIFERLCTKRTRVHDDPALLTWSEKNRPSPPGDILEVDQVDPRRIEICYRGDQGRLLFVLFKRNGRWFIDHCKSWMEGGWSNYSLNLL